MNERLTGVTKTIICSVTTRLQHATGLIRRARDRLQHARQLHRVLVHAGLGSLATKCRRRIGEHWSCQRPSSRAQGCPAVFQRPSKGLGNNLVQRYSLIASANVLTFYPQEEAHGETWAPSARRAALAKQIREVGVDILGVQEGRSRKTTLPFVRATPCGFQPQRGAALAGRSSGSATRICDHA